MKNKAKKLVAALLTVLMLLSIVPMGMLEGKCVVLGVTGGIAAYKAC